MTKKKKTKDTSVYVADSKIHGKGLFAAKTIKKGELIGCFKHHKTAIDGSYVLWFEDDLAYVVEDDFKYINHSKKANAAYYDDFTIMAIKKIKKDDEITHNYGSDWG
jgi:SET domain-containing protein